MEKICLINQPSGLGDIIFTQKILRKYLEKGYKVINPVIEHYKWLGQYITDIEYPGETENFPHKEIFSNYLKPIYSDDFVYIPLKNCQNLVPAGKYIMEQKYQMVNMEHRDWPLYLKYTRNFEKEDNLFKMLGLNEGEDYNFIVRSYQTFPNVLNASWVKSDNGLKDVELQFVPGYSLFDWCKVIENASNLFMVDSCVCYLVETLDMKSKRNVLWPRNPRTKFIELKPVFNFDWDYQE